MTVAEFTYRHEAELVKTYLESEGIEVYIDSPGYSGQGGSLQFSQGAKLIVKIENEERARELIKRMENDK